MGILKFCIFLERFRVYFFFFKVKPIPDFYIPDSVFFFFIFSVYLHISQMLVNNTLFLIGHSFVEGCQRSVFRWSVHSIHSLSFIHSFIKKKLQQPESLFFSFFFVVAKSNIRFIWQLTTFYNKIIYFFLLM